MLPGAGGVYNPSRMDTQAWIVGGILAAAVVLFVTERVRVDLVGMMVMLALVLAGILDGDDAIGGFSNEAVITIASVLVLSGGLTRTGVADVIGRRIFSRAGDRSGGLIAVIMATVGLLSGIMNDIGVTALMLPVILNISRRLGMAPSKLLMPLAFGSLLGGMTTLIGTAPNILVNEALRDAGHTPFGMFSFTPVGLVALAAGILYMTFAGRRLLPDRDPKQESTPADLDALYDLGSVLGLLTFPHRCNLVGKSLKQSRLGHALGLNVVAVRRAGELVLAPRANFELAAGDGLVVEGALERVEALKAWRHLHVESRQKTVKRLLGANLNLAEATIGEGSPLADRPVRGVHLQRTYGVQLLAITRGDEIKRTRLRESTLRPGDTLLVSSEGEWDPALTDADGPFSALHPLAVDEMIHSYHLERRLQSVKVPEESLLAGQILSDTQLADAFGLTVIGILRRGEKVLSPGAEVRLQGGDVLLLRGRKDDLEILEALQHLRVSSHETTDAAKLESEEIGLAEASLSPRTTFAGKTVEELHFREKYGVSILAIWRNGKIYRNEIRKMELRPGDAFLLYGNRRKLDFLAAHPDFLVMLPNGKKEVVRDKKAPVSALIMATVLTIVVTGFQPIYIAAPLGAVLMVLTGCLTIEEAYRSIEFKAVVLIAGMLSLGLAMEETGTAEKVADAVLGSVAGFGPIAVLAGLFLITALCAQVMPTAAVAVLMSPIALSTAASEGFSPHALMMTVAIGSSCAFLSPLGHPVNLLVMGFGGYRFSDFVKVGLPLFLIVLLVVLTVLPLVFPLLARRADETQPRAPRGRTAEHGQICAKRPWKKRKTSGS